MGRAREAGEAPSRRPSVPSLCASGRRKTPGSGASGSEGRGFGRESGGAATEREACGAEGQQGERGGLGDGLDAELVADGEVELLGVGEVAGTAFAGVGIKMDRGGGEVVADVGVQTASVGLEPGAVVQHGVEGGIGEGEEGLAVDAEGDVVFVGAGVCVAGGAVEGE